MKTPKIDYNLLCSLTVSVLIGISAVQAATIRFDQLRLASSASPANAEQSAPQSLLLALPEGASPRSIECTLHGDRVIGLGDVDNLSDQPTLIEQSEYRSIRPFYQDKRQPIVIVGEITISDRRFVEIVATHCWTDSAGFAHEIDSATITVDGNPIPDGSLVGRQQIVENQTANLRNQDTRSSSAESFEYVIITSRALATAFEPLRQYRIALGIPTTIVPIEDVLPQYSGRDNAERLRNYLKSFYATGGKYLLLGGDASIIPVRYTYPYPTDTTVDHREQLICDLYFADLTGSWDVDGDNVWGERYQDQPDATPELMVGRLPVDNAEAVSAYISKLIQYETNPGDGDPSYLARTLFFSADQMRDYGAGGQHRAIAVAYPPEFQIDTTTAVETPTGNAVSPTNIGPLDMPSATRSGFGIINVIAHGRFDGFVFRSSGYNDFPKQYLLTDGYSDVQCPFDSLGTAASPSFYYSLACDNAGFDLDRPPFSSVGTNMARELIASPQGAVGMVGNTRWGWIGSSYLLHKAFFDSLFAHPDDPAIYAMYRSQQTYWYYRDLVYGQAFLGDPQVKVYATQPRRLSVRATAAGGQCTASVASHNGPESGLTVTLSDSSGILETAVTAVDGSVSFTTELSLGQSYAVTCSGNNTTTGFVSFTSEIASDVNDDDISLPSQFELFQNYPNPFNPSTQISFGLVKPSRVSLVVFNVLGQEVVTLVNQPMTAGRHVITWDGLDAHKNPVSSGVYFYRMTAGEFTSTRKLALVR